MENLYKREEYHQELPSVCSPFEQSRRSLNYQRSLLVRAICVVVAVFVGAGPGAFGAFDGTPVSFEYNFASGTGRVISSQDPIANDITFSDLLLYNVSKGNLTPVGTIFGPFPNSAPEDHFMSLTISAPSGYLLDVDSDSLFAPAPQAFASFRLSGPGTSEAIQIRFGHNPAVSDFLPLSNTFGRLTLDQIAVPEPSTTALAGFAGAGFVLVFLLRRLRGDSSKA